MRRVLIAVSLVTLASAALIAQYRYLPTSPGTWKPWQFHAYADNRRVFAARPADVNDQAARHDWDHAPRFACQSAFHDYLIPTIRGRYNR